MQALALAPQVDTDTVWNELHSSNAARWAAGSVTDLAFKVASRELKVGSTEAQPQPSPGMQPLVNKSHPGSGSR